MPLVLRGTKGSPLTIAELDGNFSYLDGRITTLEGSAGVGIDSITVSGSIMRITMTDAAEYTFIIPVAHINPTGKWAPDTIYVENDVVIAEGKQWLCTYGHTSGTLFDSGESAGTGSDYWALFGEPTFAWTDNISDATYMPILADAASYKRFSVASEITVPANDSVNFDIDTEIQFREGAGGAITFVGENTGVVINVPIGFDASTGFEGGVVKLKKVDTDEWDLSGDLLPSSV